MRTFLLLLPALVLANESDYYHDGNVVGDYTDAAGTYHDNTHYSEPVKTDEDHGPTEAELWEIVEVTGASYESVSGLAYAVEHSINNMGGEIEESEIMGLVMELAPEYGITSYQVETAMAHLEEKHHKHDAVHRYHEATSSHESWTNAHHEKSAELANAIAEENAAREHKEGADNNLQMEKENLNNLREELAERDASRLEKAQEVQNMETIVAEHEHALNEASHHHEEMESRKWALEEEMGSVAHELEAAINHMNQMKEEHENAVLAAQESLNNAEMELSEAHNYLNSTMGHRGEMETNREHAEEALNEANMSVEAAESRVREMEEQYNNAQNHLSSLQL